MARVAAVITAYNRADFVATCVASVLDASSEHLHIIPIVMDNGSIDGTSEAARAVSDSVRVMRTEDNRPIAGVLNRGLRAALEDPLVDHIILMNEDTQFRPGALQHLLSVCERRPLSLLTPLQLNYRLPEKIDDGALDGVKSSRLLLEDLLLGRPLADAYAVPTIIGAAMLARRDVWENIGEIDELFWFYGVDDDLCSRARFLGYEILLVPAAHLLHAHGKLGSDTPATWSNPVVKWRKELQARYMFRLKQPDKSLFRCYIETLRYAVKNSIRCIISRFPRGAAESLVIYLDCVRIAPKIAATRRRHYESSRRIVRNEI